MLRLVLASLLVATPVLAACPDPFAPNAPCERRSYRDEQRELQEDQIRELREQREEMERHDIEMEGYARRHHSQHVDTVEDDE